MSKQMWFSDRANLKSRARRRLQIIVFASLYRFGGSIYDALTVFLFGNSWDRWRQASLRQFSTGPVLDIGCGTGVLVSSIADLGYQVVGIDRQSSMLVRASHRAKARGRVVRADASALPFRTASFRACVSTFPAGFIFDRATLDEVARILMPDGRFVVVITGQSDSAPWLRAPIRLILRLFYGPQKEVKTPGDELLGHPELQGTWTWDSVGADHALMWVATRNRN